MKMIIKLVIVIMPFKEHILYTDPPPLSLSHSL